MKISKSKLKSIGILMLVSELVLFLFVAVWIRGQYSAQENLMQHDIQATFNNTNETIINTFLNKTVDSLLQSDSIMPQLQIRLANAQGSDTLMNEDSLLKLLPEDIKAQASAIKASPALIHVIDGTSSGSSSPAMVVATQSLSKEIGQILRTTLLQLLNNKTLHKEGLKSFLDSNTLKNEFTKTLQIQYPKLGTAWSPAGSSSFAFKSNITDQYIVVSNYKSYVFTSILPQISFVVFLLGLTGIAFWMAFRNMRQQTKFALQKDNFISNISHELKTPVATTKVALEALSTFHGIDDPERTKRYLKVAMLEMDRLATLISSVLNTVQTENGLLSLDMEKIQLTNLISEVIETMTPILLEKDVKIVWTETLPIEISGDRVHLTGVIYNIIDNAIKYGKDLIQIELSNASHEIVITISNNGPGIPIEYQDKIFEKFFRIPSGNRHNVKGHGLGLSYAMYVIQTHGGLLRLQSDDNGTAFIITLPKS